MQKDVKAPYSCRGARTYQSGASAGVEPQAAATGAETLTFITSDNETIVFDGMDIPVGEAAALASEDVLDKIWSRPAEDLAWRDM